MSYWNPGTEPWKSGTVTRGTLAALSFGFRRVGGRREANKIIRSCSSGPKFKGFCLSERQTPPVYSCTCKPLCLRRGLGPNPLRRGGSKASPLIVCNLTCLQTPWKVLLGLLGVAALVTIITVPVVLLNKGRTLHIFKKRGWLETGSGGMRSLKASLVCWEP